VAAHLVAAVVVALAATAVAIVLNHVAPLALKAIVAVIASKAVAIVLNPVAHLLLVLKVAATRALKDASSLAVTSAANNAASRRAVKRALNPVAISAKRHVPTVALIHAVKTASTHATAVPPAHQAETMRAVVPAIVLHAALKSWVLATSSRTMRGVMQHPSALALKC
jgi:hypothetical protein